MKPDTQDLNNEQQKQETLSDTRIHPDNIFGSVARKEEFIKPGEWIYSFNAELYGDVLTAAWLEGYFVRQIKHMQGSKIQIKIQEEKPVNEQVQEDNQDDN